MYMYVILTADILSITYMCRSHDNNRIASAGADKIVQLVDVGTGQVVRKIRGHMAVSCTYNYIVLASGLSTNYHRS